MGANPLMPVPEAAPISTNPHNAGGGLTTIHRLTIKNPTMRTLSLTTLQLFRLWQEILEQDGWEHRGVWELLSELATFDQEELDDFVRTDDDYKLNVTKGYIARHCPELSA